MSSRKIFPERRTNHTVVLSQVKQSEKKRIPTVSSVDLVDATNENFCLVCKILMAKENEGIVILKNDWEKKTDESDEA